jgi:hypothetical protein
VAAANPDDSASGSHCCCNWLKRSVSTKWPALTRGMPYRLVTWRNVACGGRCRSITLVSMAGPVSLFSFAAYS